MIVVGVAQCEEIKKNILNLLCTRSITPKCVTSGGANLRGLAPGQLKRRSGGEPLATLYVRFAWAGNRTPDLCSAGDDVVETWRSKSSGCSGHVSTS